MNNYSPFILNALAEASPLLVAYLTGMILAFIYWRRYPIPSLLCLLASAVLFVTTVSQPFVTIYLFNEFVARGHWSMSDFLATVAFVGSGLRALAVGLLLGAVFSGRRAAKTAPLSPPQRTEIAPVRPGGQDITNQLD